jgi:hypothetical protein
VIRRAASFVLAALFSLAAAIGPFAGARPARAQAQRFLFIVPSGFETDVNALLEQHRADLNAAYDLYARLYGAEPPLPIYVRVYAQRAELDDQNLFVPPIAPDALHLHFGAREIALIAPFPAGWLRSSLAFDALRYELNGVFLSAIAANNLPPGLEHGVNYYVAGAPAEAEAGAARLAAASSAGELYAWRSLLTGDQVYTDPEIALPQAGAIVAFLVERYGFPALVEVVRGTSAGEPLAATMAALYGLPLDVLESEWQAALPDYLAEGWRRNALHGFDLAPYEAALAAGSYRHVIAGLHSVIPFLIQTSQTAALERAQGLLAAAQQGQAAADLVVAARAALENGSYEQALALVGQARDAFSALGYAGRESELAAYEARAREVLALRAEVADALARVEAGDAAGGEARLLALLPRLRAAGDVNSALAVENRLDELASGRARQSALYARLSRWSLVAALLLALGAGLHQAALFLRRRRLREEPVL